MSVELSRNLILLTSSCEKGRPCDRRIDDSPLLSTWQQLVPEQSRQTARDAPISIHGRNVLQKEDMRHQTSRAVNQKMDTRHILFAKVESSLRTKCGTLIPFFLHAHGGQ